MTDSLTRAADELTARGIGVGGPRKSFALAGRKQLMTLLHHGLNPDSKVLDIGCGSLRAGNWLVRLLDPGCYYGIEPNAEMLEAGVEVLLGPDLVAAKRPTFSNRDDFSMTHFNETFDMFVARSIWSHASKAQIEAMLDGFVETAAPNGTFLASYFPASAERPDYEGTEWFGKSHESDEGGTIAHDLAWIQKSCESRGLVAREARNPALNFGAQTWLRIRRAR
ncbi:class I SAM-dependent methyltransferase [Nocardioides jensenii]|uniref:class I SAM-dependent methyltransferase n=1 Tax=Nocardioides jensenii TaxID=1843 RepID=UPI00082A58D7|nr:class I SAM-dependent methyltransferase [Nocardioides jensenii]